MGASSFPGDGVRVVVVGEALGEAVAAQIGELLGSEDVASLALLGVLLDGEDVDVVDALAQVEALALADTVGTMVAELLATPLGDEVLGEAVAAQVGVFGAFFGLGVASLALLTFLGMQTGASAAASSKIGVYLLSSVYYTHVKSL